MKKLDKEILFKGIVVHGLKVGRKLGFPTANILVDNIDQLNVSNGVYVGKVYYDNKSYDGLVNIGIKPTFNLNEKKRTIEVHILNFNENIYGDHLTLHLSHFLRYEKAFSTQESLINQIHEDIKLAKSITEQSILV